MSTDEQPISDQALLEMAARAAGIVGRYNEHGMDGFGIYIDMPDTYHSVRWNPLTSSADAFDLAVGLRMKVKVQKFGYTEATLIVGFVPELRKVKSFVRVERHGADAAAATRRAIVKAAAASASIQEPA